MGMSAENLFVGDKVKINCTLEAAADSPINVTAIYMYKRLSQQSTDTTVLEAKANQDGGKAVLTPEVPGQLVRRRA